MIKLINKNLPPFRFEGLRVWDIAIQYLKSAYSVTENLPRSEEYNLKSQFIRAATSIALNIAEGSGSSSNREFKQFLNIAVRSCVETVACLKIIRMFGYISDERFQVIYAESHKLFANLQALRHSLEKKQSKDIITT